MRGVLRIFLFCISIPILLFLAPNSWKKFSATRHKQIAKDERSGTDRPAVHFITYADAKFAADKRRILEEAENTRWFASVKGFGPEDLSPSFSLEHEQVLRLARGAGFWIWKFDIIAQRADDINEGDVLVYADAGCTINPLGRERFEQYVQVLLASPLDIVSFVMNRIDYQVDGDRVEHRWTTDAIFEHFGVGAHDLIRHSGQYSATVFVLRKGPHLRRWLRIVNDALSADQWMATDLYNDASKRNNEEFVENRHDQSIASVSRKLVGSVVIPDEVETTPPRQERFPFWKHLPRTLR